MIHAYAIEPECLVKWCDLRSFRMIIKEFGLGTPRLLLEFPKSWTADVHTAKSNASLSALEQSRVTELIAHFKERKIRRKNRAYDRARSWLENAESEHADCSFAAIIASSNPRSYTAVIADTDVGDETNPLWKKPRAATPLRTPKDFCDVLASMIDNCDELHLIDPHFKPDESRYYDMLSEVLRRCASKSSPHRVICIHCKDDDSKCSKSHFESKVTRHLSIPAGIKVVFKRWKERDIGEKLHNRYILTDIGGVVLGTGLDSGAPGQTDDINLMDKDQYQKRWEQYNGATESVRAFDLVDEPRI